MARTHRHITNHTPATTVVAAGILQIVFSGGLQSAKQFVDVGGDVEHKRGGTAVRLRKCNTKAKATHLHSGSEREARQEVARISAHVGAGLVIIAQSQVNSLGGRILACKHKVAEW